MAAAAALKASKTAATAAAAAASNAGRAAAAQVRPLVLHLPSWHRVACHLGGACVCDRCQSLLQYSSTQTFVFKPHDHTRNVAARPAAQAAAEAQKHLMKHPAAAAAEASSFKTPAPPKAATRLGGADPAAAGAGALKAAAGAADSPSLTITVLDPVSTGKHGGWVAGLVCLPRSRRTNGSRIRWATPGCIKRV